MTNDLSKWFTQSIIKTKAYTFYNQHTNGQGVRVAVLDTGLVKHRLLAPLEQRIIRKSFCIDSPDPTIDETGHGTAIASLILGPISISQGDICTGVCPYIDTYYHYKISSGNLVIDNWIAAINDLLALPLNQRPHIVSMSDGANLDAATLNNPDVKLLTQKITTLSKLCAVFVAAGNEGPVWYPATLPGVFAIGGININDKPGLFSHGPEIKYCSYGVNEYVYNTQDGFTVKSGTSFACPNFVRFVTGMLSAEVKKGHDINKIIPTIESFINNSKMLRDVGNNSYTGKGYLTFE